MQQFIFNFMKDQVKQNNKIQGIVSATPTMKFTPTGKKRVAFRLLSIEKVLDTNGAQVSKKVWRNVVAWDKTAEFVQRTMFAGRSVVIECTERTASYTDANGRNREVCEYLIQRVLHLGKVNTGRIEAGTDC